MKSTPASQTSKTGYNKPEITLFSDGSSYLEECSQRAGYAVITGMEVRKAKALSDGRHNGLDSVRLTLSHHPQQS